MTSKKLLAILLTCCLIFSLIGCGETKKPDTVEPDGAAKSDYVVAYIAKESKSTFHAVLNKCAEKILDGMVSDGTISKWLFFDGQEDALIQTSLLEDALNMGANMVILLPAEEDGSAPIVAKCADKEIPCIVVNSKTSNTDDLATAYVTSDDVQAGEMMAKFVQDHFPEGGSYCHVQGLIGNSAQVQRGEGIHNILDADSKWSILDEQAASWDAAKGVQFAEDWLNIYGDKINAIICDDDDSAAAIQLAMNAAGRKDILCIGVNGNPTACSLISNGDMLGTIYQDGEGQMTKALEIAKNIITGSNDEKGTVLIDYVYITKDNVADYVK